MTDAERKRSAFFIAVDDLRPELGCYGHPVVNSPNIDALAKRALLFDRAYCQQAVCNPSRVSLMTSLRPETIGVLDLPTHFRDKMPDAVTVAQHFKANGYHTQAFGKVFHTGHGNRDDPLSWSTAALLPNKARAQARFGEDKVAKAHEAPDKKAAFAAPDVADNNQPDGIIAERTIACLGEIEDRQFFLAVGFLKPHLPFIAPKKYWVRGGRGSLSRIRTLRSPDRSRRKREPRGKARVPGARRRSREKAPRRLARRAAAVNSELEPRRLMRQGLCILARCAFN